MGWLECLRQCRIYESGLYCLINYLVYGISLPNKINNEGGIPENLLLTETSTGWKLAAVIDFGDVMTGWREYDLLGPSTFICAGVPGRLQSFLEGYGVTAEDYDDAMRRRLTTLMMLHGASDMRGIAIPDWQSSVRTLGDLEDLIWPKTL